MTPASTKPERPTLTSGNNLLDRPVVPKANTSPMLQNGRVLLKRSDASELSAESLNPFRPLTVLPSSNRSWASSPYSNRSPCSSTASLLSPPASEIDETEPPPFKSSAGDHVSLSMLERSDRGKKGRRNSARRWQSEKKMTESFGNGSRTRKPKRRRSRVNTIEATDAFAGGQLKLTSQSRRSSTLPKMEDPGRKQSLQQNKRRGSWWWRLRTVTVEDQANVGQLASKSQIKGNWLRTVQPGTASCIQDTVDHSDWASTSSVTNARRWSIMEDGAAAIPSFTTAFAPPPLSENLHGRASNEETQVSRTRKGVGSKVKSSAQGPNSGNCRRKGGESKRHRPDSPATITLRRASGVPKRRSTTRLSYPPTIRSLLQDAMDDLNKNGPPLLSSELQSSRRSKSPTPTVSSSPTSTCHGPSSAGTGTEENLIQSRPGEAVDDTRTPILPRQIFTAEPATTFTHVQVATPIMTESTGGLDVSTAHHRLSTTQTVQARNSIYEIIWNDNEASTSPDSSIQTTPKPDALPERSIASSGSSSLNGNSDEISHLPSDSAAFDLVHAGNSMGSRVSETIKDESFAEWNWTTKRRLSASGTIENSTDVNKGKDALSSTIANLKKDDDRPTPVLIVQSVQSFPPLLDRRSTQDWITPCLIDLNDPHAGRIPGYRAPSSPSPAEISTSDSLDAQVKIASHPSASTIISRGKRRSSIQSHFSAPQRITDNTKIGYALGASSGMRRRSVHIPRKRSARRLSFTTGANPLASSPTSTHANPLLMLSDAATSRESNSVNKADLVAPHIDSSEIRSHTTGLETEESEDELYPSMDDATDSSEVQRYDGVSDGS
ncbi:MAG: hypothetical protein M1812_006115 [Candelaria pacifica]|nr:MAG: hypothetical protein M1812_006115 [Candelaria pacifica]